jgi:hypothetical protein
VIALHHHTCHPHLTIAAGPFFHSQTPKSLLRVLEDYISKPGETGSTAREFSHDIFHFRLWTWAAAALAWAIGEQDVVLQDEWYKPMYEVFINSDSVSESQRISSHPCPLGGSISSPYSTQLTIRSDSPSWREYTISERAIYESIRYVSCMWKI